MLRRSEPASLIGVSLKAATMVFSMRHDATILGATGPGQNAAAIEDCYRHLNNSSNTLLEYISELERQCGIQQDTFYRRD